MIFFKQYCIRGLKIYNIVIKKAYLKYIILYIYIYIPGFEFSNPFAPPLTSNPGYAPDNPCWNSTLSREHPFGVENEWCYCPRTVTISNVSFTKKNIQVEIKVNDNVREYSLAFSLHHINDENGHQTSMQHHFFSTQIIIIQSNLSGPH